MKKQVETKPNKQSTKKEFLLFISVPLSIMVIAAGILLVPGLFAKPKYDFVYSYCPEYGCENVFELTGSRIQETNVRSRDFGNTTRSELYRYDIQTSSYQRLTLAEANNLALSTSSVSPDGYSLTNGEGSSGSFMFWGGNYDDNWYLKSGLKKKRVSLGNNNYYSGNVKLIGWIK